MENKDNIEEEYKNECVVIRGELNNSKLCALTFLDGGIIHNIFKDYDAAMAALEADIVDFYNKTDWCPGTVRDLSEVFDSECLLERGTIGAKLSSPESAEFPRQISWTIIEIE